MRTEPFSSIHALFAGTWVRTFTLYKSMAKQLCLHCWFSVQDSLLLSLIGQEQKIAGGDYILRVRLGFKKFGLRIYFKVYWNWITSSLSAHRYTGCFSFLLSGSPPLPLYFHLEMLPVTHFLSKGDNGNSFYCIHRGAGLYSRTESVVNFWKDKQVIFTLAHRFNKTLPMHI